MKKHSGVGTNGTLPADILSVSPILEDHIALARILHATLADPRLEVQRSFSLQSAFSILQETPVTIVICEADLLPGTWREILDYASALPDPPLLIVTSRLADERLWAEALNLGAYDVLAKPFSAGEVIRIVGSACRRWKGRNDPQCAGAGYKQAAVGA